MNLQVERYVDQRIRWPQDGRHILAQFDANSIVVYQAYRPEIGLFAAEHGHLGGPYFSRGRMSWVKPNFLWMMYRCGWARKEGQEVVLAIRLRREGFETILRRAVHSTCSSDSGRDHEEWQRQIKQSDVRLQWDPDHDPHGTAQPRRAIQLGLRGEALRAYCDDWTISIKNITEFVHQQRNALDEEGIEALIAPREGVYPVDDSSLRDGLGISPCAPASQDYSGACGNDADREQRRACGFGHGA